MRFFLARKGPNLFYNQLQACDPFLERKESLLLLQSLEPLCKIVEVDIIVLVLVRRASLAAKRGVHRHSRQVGQVKESWSTSSWRSRGRRCRGGRSLRLLVCFILVKVVRRKIGRRATPLLIVV